MKKQKPKAKRRSFNHGAVGSIPTGLTKKPHVSGPKSKVSRRRSAGNLGKIRNKPADSRRNTAQSRHTAFARRSARAIARGIADSLVPAIEELLSTLRDQVSTAHRAIATAQVDAARRQDPPLARYQPHLPLELPAVVRNPLVDFVKASYVPEVGAAVRLSEVAAAYNSAGGAAVTVKRIGKMLRATFGPSCIGAVWFSERESSGKALLGWRARTPADGAQ